jgi:tetrahydromethanopterin S-methyltransferase subunit G
MSRQARLDQVTDKENKEKEFEPITQRLDRVEKAVRQTDDDLIKKLELMPL